MPLQLILEDFQLAKPYDSANANYLLDPQFKPYIFCYVVNGYTVRSPSFGLNKWLDDSTPVHTILNGFLAELDIYTYLKNDVEYAKKEEDIQIEVLHGIDLDDLSGDSPVLRGDNHILFDFPTNIDTVYCKNEESSEYCDGVYIGKLKNGLNYLYHTRVVDWGVHNLDDLAERWGDTEYDEIKGCFKDKKPYKSFELESFNVLVVSDSTDKLIEYITKEYEGPDSDSD